MVYLWNATGDVKNLAIEPFAMNDTYSINIMVVDPINQNVLDTRMFTNVSSKKNPLVQLFPKNFDVSNSQVVNLIIQDNTFYTTQTPLQLFLQYDQTQKPYLIQFDNIQQIGNIAMRTANIPNVPYKNIIITFKN